MPPVTVPHVTVSPGYVEVILGLTVADAAAPFHAGPVDGVYTQLYSPATAALEGRTYFSGQDLAKVTVFDALEAFHIDICKSLDERDPNLLDDWRTQIENLGKTRYHRPSFQATGVQAKNSLALHKLFPHGTIAVMHGTQSHRSEVYLPDFSVGARLFGLLVDPRVKGPDPEDGVRQIGKQTWHIRNFPLAELWTIECHLCDRLDDVCERARAYAQQKALGHNFPCPAEEHLSSLSHHIALSVPDIDDQPILVIGAVIEGFHGYRSLQAANVDVPSVGGHRLLAAAAIRQRLAMPVATSVFPYALWRTLPPAIKDFVLNATELVGRSCVQVLFPDAPTKDEFERGLPILDAAIMGRMNRMEVVMSSRDFTAEYGSFFALLGLRGPLERWILEHPKELDLGEMVSGIGPITLLQELFAACHGGNVETSLSRKSVLELQPLHKRILGLLEYLVVRRLSGEGRVASRWRTAFKNDNPNHTHPDGACFVAKDDNPTATLATEGGWLIHAARLPTANHCRLADLLDDLMLEIGSQLDFEPGTLGLAPKNPTDHAFALATISAPTDQGRRLLLYLGNIIIGLRNYIEHGIDEPYPQGLMVENAQYWMEPRQPLSRHSKRDEWPEVLEWNRSEGRKVLWSRQAYLPAAVPPAANKLLLDNESMQRCLTLIALVLHGAKKHLNRSDS